MKERTRIIDGKVVYISDEEDIDVEITGVVDSNAKERVDTLEDTQEINVLKDINTLEDTQEINVSDI